MMVGGPDFLKPLWRDTGGYMSLQPHQERVLNEKKELDDKIGKLREFLSKDGGIFDSVPKEEQFRLKEQLEYMEHYSDVLRRRIEAF